MGSKFDLSRAVCQRFCLCYHFLLRRAVSRQTLHDLKFHLVWVRRTGPARPKR